MMQLYDPLQVEPKVTVPAVLSITVQFLNSQFVKVAESTSKSNRTLLNTILSNIGAEVPPVSNIVKFSYDAFPKVVTVTVLSGALNLVCCCEMPLTVI